MTELGVSSVRPGVIIVSPRVSLGAPKGFRVHRRCLASAKRNRGVGDQGCAEIWLEMSAAGKEGEGPQGSRIWKNDARGRNENGKGIARLRG